MTSVLENKISAAHFCGCAFFRGKVGTGAAKMVLGRSVFKGCPMCGYLTKDENANIHHQTLTTFINEVQKGPGRWDLRDFMS